MKTIIVAGITRSGLTMTMQMLNAGGYPCAGEYPAFEPYDIGEIPFEKLKGKAIKAVDTHLQFPPTGDYLVIRLKRNMTEQSKSIAKFIKIMGVHVNRSEMKQMKKNLPKDYAKIDAWAKRQKECLDISFEEILANPKGAAELIEHYAGTKLDTEKMANVVVKRGAECYDGLLEAKQVNEM